MTSATNNSNRNYPQELDTISQSHYKKNFDKISYPQQMQVCNIYERDKMSSEDKKVWGLSNLVGGGLFSMFGAGVGFAAYKLTNFYVTSIARPFTYSESENVRVVAKSVMNVSNAASAFIGASVQSAYNSNQSQSQPTQNQNTPAPAAIRRTTVIASSNPLHSQTVIDAMHAEATAQEKESFDRVTSEIVDDLLNGNLGTAKNKLKVEIEKSLEAENTHHQANRMEWDNAKIKFENYWEGNEDTTDQCNIEPQESSIGDDL